MKLIELLNKIANGEIKEGTKIGTNLKKGLVFKDGTLYCEDTIVTFTDITQKGLNVEVEIIEEEPKGRWKPKGGEHYWYIDTYREIHRGIWIDDSPDNWRYANKNLFKTKAEAEEYFEYKTALLEVEKPFVKNEINCKLTFSTIDRIALISANYDVMSQGSIYLGQDEDVAQAFLDKWKEQIMKYEFGIEE